MSVVKNLKVKTFLIQILIFTMSLFLISCGGSSDDERSRNGGLCSEDILAEYDHVTFLCENINGSSPEADKDNCQLAFNDFTSRHPNFNCVTAAGEEIDEESVEGKYLDPIVSYQEEIDSLFE